MEHSKGTEFRPFIPADRVMPELTPFSVIAGIVLAVVFGAANAYLGLRVGMTVSASVPAAVISMGVTRFLFKRNSILENNVVQTIGSAGESLAAGAIFTLPALFMWHREGICDAPSVIMIMLLTLCGGILGVLMMIPLRNALIVQEHGTLEYPEGVACAEVLKAGEAGGSSTAVFSGLGFSAVYKFLADGVKLFPSSLTWEIPGYPGGAVGFAPLPALLGVGYICNLKTASMLMAGGVLSWLVLMPAIVFFGAGSTVFPAEQTIGELFAAQGASAIWSSYIRYIGAGALIAGGLISMVKSMPMLVGAFTAAMRSVRTKGELGSSRADSDLSVRVILIGILLTAVFLWVCPVTPVDGVGTALVVIFGFFFATVAARIAGIVGSSNNPASGMTIATLLVTAVIFKLSGGDGPAVMVKILCIGTLIACIVNISNDTSQDLKTGFLLGATPKKQQIGELIGVVASSLVIGGILYLLDSAWGFGSAELTAPQATMMKTITEGVIGGDLPWTMIFIGAGLAVVFELLGLASLPIAIGIYLPLESSFPMFLGGLIRRFIEKKKYSSDTERDEAVNNGVLYTSGMIAGEGLVGVLLAVFAVVTVGGRSVGEIIDVSGSFSLGSIGSLVFFALLVASLLRFCGKKSK